MEELNQVITGETSDNLKMSSIVLDMEKWVWQQTHFRQVIDVEDVRIEGQGIFISPSPDSIGNYSNARVMCAEQLDKALAFYAEKIPVNNLTVYVAIAEGV